MRTAHGTAVFAAEDVADLDDAHPTGFPPRLSTAAVDRDAPERVKSKGVIRGDFGFSCRHEIPAMGLVLEHFPNTVLLAVTAVVIALRTWIVYARVVRGEVLSLKENEFVVGAKAAGCSTMRILFVYLFPNVTSTAIVIATLYPGRMIIIESALSFLGLGVPPPTPTWGGMLAEGRSFLDTAWWIALFPGLILMLTILSVNLLGDWLRDVLDPRMKRTTE
ncbi:ABC transporter permease [Nitrospinota bacterium]